MIRQFGFLQKMGRNGRKQAETRVSAQLLGSSAGVVAASADGRHHGTEEGSSSDVKVAVLGSGTPSCCLLKQKPLTEQWGPAAIHLSI